LLFFAAVVLSQRSCSSPFTTSDGNTYYLYDGWFNVTDQNNVEWYFSVCATTEESPCGLDNGEIVSVCQIFKEIPVPKGHADTIAITQTPSGSENGLEIIYGLESPAPIKTVIELLCSNNENTKIKIIDEAMSVITFSSPRNCPSENLIYDADMPLGDSGSSETRVVISGAFIYFLFLCCSLISVCCCCTCLLRRRRNQQRKDIQMKQFSSVAFQPIPKTTTSNTQQPQTLNQPMVQPQFVYYYPSQYNQNTVQNDEAIARNLQAQFDQESV